MTAGYLRVKKWRKRHPEKARAIYQYSTAVRKARREKDLVLSAITERKQAIESGNSLEKALS